MKALNQRAEKVFRKLIEMAQKAENSYVKIDTAGPSFMPVVVECVGNSKNTHFSGKIWSIAHYFEQMGDLCADPEMTFLETQRGIYPLSFQMQGSILAKFEQSVNLDPEKSTYIPRLQKDHASFANQWMINIKRQQTF